MESQGFGKLTVEGIVNEIGTTRQTFYRRYSSLTLLALDVLMSRFGGENEVNTGKLESDLLELQRNDVAMMTTPLIQKNLPGLFEDFPTESDVRDLYYAKMIYPRRQNVGRVISLAVHRAEIPYPNVDSEYICDLLF